MSRGSGGFSLRGALVFGGLLGGALLVLGALPMLPACNILPQDSTDAAGIDTNGATGTIGDQCTDIYNVLCQRAISSCGVATTLSDCVASGQTQCCGSKCANPAITPDVTINSCVEAINAEDCNDIVNNTVPAICMGIPALM